jgi:hypothetical protein
MGRDLTVRSDPRTAGQRPLDQAPEDASAMRHRMDAIRRMLGDLAEHGTVLASHRMLFAEQLAR